MDSQSAPTAPQPDAPAAAVLAWEFDPGAPGSPNSPVARPVPDLSTGPLRVAIRGRKPPARKHRPGTSEFRYWAAAEALRRAADMWAPVLPAGTTWVPSVGDELPVLLDSGEDVKAYYDRSGLHFFHEPVNGVTVYSGESPSVACHELGHAVLDALRPQLFHAGSIEIAAFHESFGDISAILSGLQLESVRASVLAETRGKLYRASSLSRLAEQLGWAIRQDRPDLAEPDCMRNAVNSFFYQEPSTLPAAAPASQLSSEPHSFSRVFTGSFLQALAGMFALQATADADALLTAATDSMRLLIEGVCGAPVAPSYYSQVAAHMIAADGQLFAGRYGDALKSGFVAHGIIAFEGALALSPDTLAPAAALGFAAGDELPRVRVPAGHYGVGADLLVDGAAQLKVLDVAGAAADLGSVQPPSHEAAVRSFLEDLFRRGRIDVGDHAVAGTGVVNPLGAKTHELRQEADGLVLHRRIFDCGFAGP
jgi:hypothetical protein